MCNKICIPINNNNGINKNIQTKLLQFTIFILFLYHDLKKIIYIKSPKNIKILINNYRI